MLDLQVGDGVAWITLKRPQVLNAINKEMADLFLQKLEEVEKRSDVRVVITRGEGKGFCSGSDLRELAPLAPVDATRYELEFAKVFCTLDRLPQPTIVMLHGHALGGGLGLALYHDFRIAASTASLGMPEVELGWAPPWAMGRLAEIVGFAKARWILMTCNTMTGAEAAQIGLVDEAVPEDQLLAKAEQLAKKLAAMPPEGLKQTKLVLNRMSTLRRFDWDAAASEAFRVCYEKPEAQKRITDFVARKKKP
jgi:enoyl-CoA hydratase/carnithine racemase